jgi:hypothetical protein
MPEARKPRPSTTPADRRGLAKDGTVPPIGAAPAPNTACARSGGPSGVVADYARSRGYQKRGGGCTLVSLEDAPDLSHKQEVDVLALDEALTRLAAFDPRMSQVVEMEHFRN